MQKHSEELLFALILAISYVVAGLIGCSAFKRFSDAGKLFWLLAFPWTLPLAPLWDFWAAAAKATGRGLLILVDFMLAVLLVSIPTSLGIFAAMTGKEVGPAVLGSFFAMLLLSGFVLWAIDVLRTGRWW